MHHSPDLSCPPEHCSALSVEGHVTSNTRWPPAAELVQAPWRFANRWGFKCHNRDSQPAQRLKNTDQVLKEKCHEEKLLQINTILSRISTYHTDTEGLWSHDLLEAWYMGMVRAHTHTEKKLKVCYTALKAHGVRNTHLTPACVISADYIKSQSDRSNSLFIRGLRYLHPGTCSIFSTTPKSTIYTTGRTSIISQSRQMQPTFIRVASSQDRHKAPAVTSSWLTGCRYTS